MNTRQSLLEGAYELYDRSVRRAYEEYQEAVAAAWGQFQENSARAETEYLGECEKIWAGGGK